MLKIFIENQFDLKTQINIRAVERKEDLKRKYYLKMLEQFEREKPKGNTTPFEFLF